MSIQSKQVVTNYNAFNAMYVNIHNIISVKIKTLSQNLHALLLIFMTLSTTWYNYGDRYGVCGVWKERVLASFSVAIATFVKMNADTCIHT